MDSYHTSGAGLLDELDQHEQPLTHSRFIEDEEVYEYDSSFVQQQQVNTGSEQTEQTETAAGETAAVAEAAAEGPAVVSTPPPAASITPSPVEKQLNFDAGEDDDEEDFIVSFNDKGVGATLGAETTAAEPAVAAAAVAAVAGVVAPESDLEASLVDMHSGVVVYNYERSSMNMPATRAGSTAPLSSSSMPLRPSTAAASAPATLHSRSGTLTTPLSSPSRARAGTARSSTLTSALLSPSQRASISTPSSRKGAATARSSTVTSARKASAAPSIHNTLKRKQAEPQTPSKSDENRAPAQPLAAVDLSQLSPKSKLQHLGDLTQRLKKQRTDSMSDLASQQQMLHTAVQLATDLSNTHTRKMAEEVKERRQFWASKLAEVQKKKERFEKGLPLTEA